MNNKRELAVEEVAVEKRERERELGEQEEEEETAEQVKGDTQMNYITNVYTLSWRAHIVSQLIYDVVC